MSQTWSNIPPTGSASVALVTSIPNALEALRTTFSGGSAPSSPVAYMLWADTSTGLLKIRNSANTDWITIGTLTQRHDWITHLHEVGSIGDNTIVDMLVAPCDMTIDKLLVVSDTTTVGSASEGNYGVMIENVSQEVDLLSAEQTTDGAEITADTPWSVTPDQNTNLNAGDLIRVTIAVNGSGPGTTGLSAARVTLQLQGYPR
jgi:hypothetical protein